MAVVESYESRQTRYAGRDSTHQRQYAITNETSETAALTALIAEAPTTYTVVGIILAKVEYDITPTSQNTWQCLVNYSHASKENPEDELTDAGDSQYSFDFTGQSVNVKEAYSQTAYGADSPDYGTSINVQSDGTVEGVDVEVPKGVYTETRIFDATTVTQAWVAARAKMVGTVNDATFKGFAAGELLFTSFSGQRQGSDLWSVTFSWAISENETGLTVAGIAGVDKPGWDYLWVQYKDAEDATAKKLVPEAVGVYVAEVYKSADFSTLGV